MKLTAIILLIACLTASARTYSQITLAEKNAPLTKVFREIQKQSGYDFFYSYEVVSKAGTVSVNVKNVSLETAVKTVLKGKSLDYQIIGKTVVIKAANGGSDEEQNPSPPIDVKGRIVDENGKPVIATVSVKGTNIKTSTNENGEFELKSLEENSILVITAVNIETFELEVAGRTELNLTAKTKAIQMDEVTVEANTGYQKIKPNEINGSVVVIDNKTLNSQTGTNILQRLDAVVPGLIFNIGKQTTNQGVPSKTNISIRGISTINGPMDPIIVVDNFPYEGDISNINPNDVESITILKDAAATSIYGAKGGNGVIVITTKSGQFNQKVSIQVNSNLFIAEKPDLYYLNSISSADYVDVEEFLFNRGFYAGDLASPIMPALSPAVEIFLKRKSGLITAADSANQINALKQIDSREQYYRYFYRNSVTHQHSINVRGGSHNLAWLLSGAYDKNISELSAQADKINFKVSNKYRPTKNLIINVDAYLTSATSKADGTPSYNGVTIFNKVVPYLRFADEAGNPIAINHILRETYTDTVGNGQLLNWKYYPLEDYKHIQSTNQRKELLANLGLTYQASKSLRLELRYQYQFERSENEVVEDAESFSARDLVNRFTNLAASAPFLRHPVPMGGIYRYNSGKVISQAFRGQMHYSRLFKDFQVSALMGTEIREIKAGGGKGMTLYGYKTNPLAFGRVDYVTSFPVLPIGTRTISGAPVSAGFVTTRFLSLYGNASVTFLKKYVLNVSVRRDASNMFGVNTNDRWKPLWSGGLGWEISREKFYSAQWLPFLKAKATYGYSGNIDTRKTALPILNHSILNQQLTNLPFADIFSLNDPNLRWEQVAQLNAGIEFSTKKQIITGSIEYFIKRSTDLYGETNYDYTTWGDKEAITRNIADLKGQGIDALITTKNIDRQFKWSSTLIFNYNTNKVTKYLTEESQKGTSLIGASGVYITPVVGKPLFSIAAYRWGGLDATGDPLGYVNGQLSKDYAAISAEATANPLSSDNLVYFKSASPTVFGSFINSFSWDNLTASVNISYRFGYYFSKEALDYESLFFSGVGTRDFERRWRKPGDELFTNVPAMVYSNYPGFSNRKNFYNNSELHVLKGDHIRLNYVHLAYSLSRIEKKLPIKQAQLHLNIANLGILWRANNEELDPDYPSTFPPSKKYTVGLSITL